MKFNLFNLNKDGKGVDLNEDTTPNLQYYFKSLWRKLTKLISINLLAILQFVPLLVAILARFWADTKPTITNLAFPLLDGISEFSPSPAIEVLRMLASPQFNVSVLSLGTRITIFAGILVFALIFGWCNVGFTYLMRELVNGRPVFIFSDLKHAIKRNAKQGFLVGLIDFAIIFVLGFNVYNMASDIAGGFFGDFFYVANVAIALIYVIMRFYIYLMLVTFDMKILKIFKNALIFVMLGIKRNLMAILGVACMAILNVGLIFIYTPLGVILPILYIAAVPMFTTTYAAYPVIQRYMIDASPYASDVNEQEEEEETETIFSDNTTLSAEELWQQFVEQENIQDVEDYGIRSFGENADEAAAAILNGTKTATSTPHPLYAKEERPLPYVGEYSVVVDSQESAICIIQTQKVYVLPFDKITAEHAEMEGGRDKSLKNWKQLHKVTFAKKLEAVDLPFSENMRVVCEQFKVVYKPN